MTKIPAVPKPDVPAFLDETVVQIQDALKLNLSWLNHSFGRSQKLIDKDTKKYYPGIHIGYEKYINVFPDQELGNFCFLKMNDPGILGKQTRELGKYKTKYSLIFWMNLDSIFVDKKDRNSEAVKLQILNLLSQGLFLTTARLSVSQVYEGAQKIYEGYDIKEFDSQFLMQPYYGLRFDGELVINKFCKNNIIFVGGTPVSYRNMQSVEQMMSAMQLELTTFKNDAYDDGMSVDGGIIM